MVEFVPNNLALIPVNRSNHEDSSVHQANFEALEGFLVPLTSRQSDVGPWLSLARIVGGVVVRGEVNEAVASTRDSEFAHSLGRRPVAIFYSLATDGFEGQVVGAPGGGGVESGGTVLNEAQWTPEMFSVKATRAAEYIMVVV